MRTLSIITPVLNRAATISRALESASRLRQATDWQMEHLVMDGGSTDGTLGEVAYFEPEVSVFSEEDEGLYEAINRGIERATGQYVWLLNSDDELIPANAARLLRHIENSDFPEAAWGGAELARSDRPSSSEADVLRGRIYGPMSPVSVMFGASIINARILRRDVFARVGTFDPSFRIAGDREFLIRLVETDVDAVMFDDPVYRYHMHERSLTMMEGRASRPTLHEYVRIAQTYQDDRSVSPTVRIAARTWGAWSRFLLEVPEGAKPVHQLAKWSAWSAAPRPFALLGAVLAKGWLRGSTRLRSLQVS